MLISDLDHMEQITEKSNVKGGFDFSSIMQLLNIYPAASSSINTLGGHSIGNTVTTMNISIPIFIIVNYSSGRSPQGRFTPYFLKSSKALKRGFLF